MRFKFTALKLSGLILVEHEAVEDRRGSFSETFREREFSDAGIPGPFVQENHSRSFRSVLRGLHFQKKPKAMAKLVRCVRGEIYDVAVDLRRDSPTFGQWVGAALSDTNRQMLYVPVGFAHGFQALSETADVAYRQTEYYLPENDCGVVWNDPDIAIRWPISEPVVSARDSALPRLRDVDKEF